MKPEDQLLLLCLRQDFTDGHIQAVSGLAQNTTLDWERISHTAEQHGISTLVLRNLIICQNDGLDIPEKAIKKLKLSTYKNAVIKKQQTERLIRALSYLNERNLEVMLIKGAALDCNIYENADYTLSDDIDIMIHARREDLAREKLDDINIFLHDQGIEYEFFVHHDLDITGLLPIDFESIWEHAEQAEYHGHPVLLMSTTDLLVSLCINSSRKRYFRLKSLYDLSEVIQTKQDISWKEIARRARIFQCESIIYTALLVTKLTTGCYLGIGWEEYFRSHPFRRKLIKTTINYLTRRISFYPYPFSGVSITGRPLHLSLILPYLGYTRSQIVKKLSYTIHVQDN